MFDFRYHALSLMAVFIALVVGLLLGVVIGDKELLSSTQKDVGQSLRADVRAADSQRGDALAKLAQQRQYVNDLFPISVGGRLSGKQIGLILLGDDSRSIVQAVGDAVQPAGAQIKFVAVVRPVVDITQAAGNAAGTRYAALTGDGNLLAQFGQRLGVQVVTGGKLITKERTTVLRSLSGQFGGLDGVVVARSPAVPTDGAAAARADTLEAGIATGLASLGIAAVGVETQDTDPSQVSWYRNNQLSSIDDVDLPIGRAALVFALAGSDGAFGIKDSAQARLPPVVTPTTGGP